jgi:DnaJ-class molecular chaperone
LLGVARDASARDIKRAYRKLAALHHPDKAAEDEREASELMYLEIGEAYEVLLDEKKRKLYDEGNE